MQSDLFNNKTTFMQDMIAGEKKDCPCCGRYAQVYRRKIHKTMAKKAILFYGLGGHKNYVHTSQLNAGGESGGGDFCKLKHWGLIEESFNTDEAKKNSGFWRLTPLGVDFILNKVSVKEKAVIFDDRTIGFEGDDVFITTCLAGSGFNYSELMEAA